VLRIDHLRYRRFVDAFVDGELDGGLRRRVADHVAVCPMCSHDADLTVHVKHSLARRRDLTTRAAERLRRLARRHPG
jgi:anti-sigma factor RsiW